jgi:hypothetical protein
MSDKHSTPTPREFLDQMFGPDLPRHLVAIREKGVVAAVTFEASDPTGLNEWVAQHNGMDNLYFTVNRLKPGCANRKAKKEDVDAALFLHVDIDDPTALERIVAFRPQPAAVVFSGGGYQAFWPLAEETKELTRVERINKGIAESLGGDNCQNIDRIMRLPGTINVPNKKKRAAGRVPTRAYVVEEATDWSRRYELDDFAELEGAVRLTETALSPVDITPISLEALPVTVSKETAALIVHGDDLARPMGAPDAHFRSRSEVVFRVACDLARVGCGIRVIAGILVNPELGVSTSVLEKSRPGDYALRQADRATAIVGQGWPDIYKNGSPRPTFRNAMLALLRLGLEFSSDQFRYRKFVQGMPLQEFADELSDDLCFALRKFVIDKFSFDAGKENIRDAAHTLCLENPFHPVRQYLDQLKWDGVPRIGKWLTTYLGAEATPLNEAIGMLILIAAVRRVREPGTKFDTIMVLEGVQGGGKSTAIKILAGQENFSDQALLSLDPKSQMEAIEGVWLYEIAELEGMSRSDTARVKAFASRTVDQARLAYGRFKERRPRQTVFIGTTNDDKYLRDATGNRRFWPVKVGVIDLEALRRDRDQLWAEAAYWEEKGETLFLAKELWPLAQLEQDARVEDDPWMDTLSQISLENCDLVGGYLRISSNKVLREVLEIPIDRQQQYLPKRIAGLMRKLGWDGPRLLKMKDGSTLRAYQRPVEPNELDQLALPPW